MLFGAFSYAYSTNLGDEIQTLSASQYLPRIDVLIERDRLHWYRNYPEIFVVFNGWFNHQPCWPPPDSISPLFVAFYAAHPNELIDKRFASYFKRYEPIGCRSFETMEAFHKIGVDAYFSGCLTLTLEREAVARTNQVYAVDVDPEMYGKLVPDQIKRQAVRLTHEEVPSDFTLFNKAKWAAAYFGLRGLYKWESGASMLRGAGEKLNKMRHAARVTMARELLKRYSSAKLVITSRLHCALPCVAFGTPVILLRRGIESDPRFAGLRQLVRYHSDPSQPIKIDWEAPEPNPMTYLSFAKELRTRCEEAAKLHSNANVPLPHLSAEAASLTE